MADLPFIKYTLPDYPHHITTTFNSTLNGFYKSIQGYIKNDTPLSFLIYASIDDALIPAAVKARGCALTIKLKHMHLLSSRGVLSSYYLKNV